MALKIYEKFAPRANPGDTNYPDGSIKNESAPGAKDGTPLDADWGNDYAGFDAALFAEAGITPNGDPDTALDSQRLSATKIIAANVVTRYNPETVQSLLDSTELDPDGGEVFKVQGYHSVGVGGGTWKTVQSSSVTTNSYNPRQCSGVPELAIVLIKYNSIDIAQWGGVNDGLNADDVDLVLNETVNVKNLMNQSPTNNTPLLDLIASITSEGDTAKIYIPKGGAFHFSGTTAFVNKGLIIKSDGIVTHDSNNIIDAYGELTTLQVAGGKWVSPEPTNRPRIVNAGVDNLGGMTGCSRIVVKNTESYNNNWYLWPGLDTGHFQFSSNTIWSDDDANDRTIGPTEAFVNFTFYSGVNISPTSSRRGRIIIKDNDVNVFMQDGSQQDMIKLSGPGRYLGVTGNLFRNRNVTGCSAEVDSFTGGDRFLFNNNQMIDVMLKNQTHKGSLSAGPNVSEYCIITNNHVSVSEGSILPWGLMNKGSNFTINGNSINANCTTKPENSFYAINTPDLDTTDPRTGLNVSSRFSVYGNIIDVEYENDSTSKLPRSPFSNDASETALFALNVISGGDGRVKELDNATTILALNIIKGADKYDAQAIIASSTGITALNSLINNDGTYKEQQFGDLNNQLAQVSPQFINTDATNYSPVIRSKSVNIQGGASIVGFAGGFRGDVFYCEVGSGGLTLNDGGTPSEGEALKVGGGTVTLSDGDHFRATRVGSIWLVEIFN